MAGDDIGAVRGIRYGFVHALSSLIAALMEIGQRQAEPEPEAGE